MPMRPTLTAALLVSFSAAASAQEFDRYHLFGVSPNQPIIQEVDREGSLVREFGAFPDLTFPLSLAFGPDGRLYVTDGATDEVVVFTADGEVDDRVGFCSLSQPLGLAFGALGELSSAYGGFRGKLKAKKLLN